MFVLCTTGLFSVPANLYADEPEAYLQANSAAQAHALNPSGWVATDLKTVTAPGDGNTWSGGKVLVRAFTNPAYYNLTSKKNQTLYPGALWVTTGNELPAWYRDPANGVNAGNISLKTAELHGLPTSSIPQYNAIVELLVDPAKLVRPTRDPNVAAQPTALPTQPFAAKPASMLQADYEAYKTWYTANISSSYGAANPDNRYPWTQMGYTYNWGGDQSDLSSIKGLSEFVLLGTKSGVTSPLETFAVYSIQSYIYRVGTDGDGIGNFNVTGPLDTLWSGTKFQPAGNRINIGQGAVVSGGEGIYLSSAGYTVTNSGSIIGSTSQKYYGDAPAGTSVYFLDGGTFINSATGIMRGDDIAIGGGAAGQGVNVTNYGYMTGNSYAIRTGAGSDSLTVENGGVLRGSVALGTGTDQITIKPGGTWQPVLNRGNGTISTLQAANIAFQNGSVITPLFSGTGLLPSSSSFSMTQGAVTSNFTTLLDQYPLFDFSINNAGGALGLVVTRVPYQSAVAAIDPGLLPIAASLYSQLGTASGDMALILSSIDSSGSTGAVAGAMRQLGPSINTALPHVSFSTDRTRLERLQDRSAPFPDERSQTGKESWKGFALASGGWGDQDSYSLIPGFSYDGWSSQAGMQKSFSSSLTAGFALGGSQTFINSKDLGGSSITVDSVSPVLFASISSGQLHTDLMLGYSYNRYDSSRRIVFDEINRTASAGYDGHQLSTLLSASYRFMADSMFFLEPFAGLYLSGLFQGGYDEGGAGAASLSVGAADYWSLRSHIGPRAGSRFRIANGEIALQLVALWVHEFNNSLNGLDSSFYGTGSSFSTSGIRYERDSVEAAFKADCLIKKDISISAEYAANVSATSIENSIKIGLEWKFW